MDPPYGYTEEDIEYLIAVLYRKGQIRLKMNSMIFTPANTAYEDAYKYITKRGIAGNQGGGAPAAY